MADEDSREFVASVVHVLAVKATKRPEKPTGGTDKQHDLCSLSLVAARNS